jgi:nitrite reductase/ring-hydroxylating ferredoxin subunit
MDYVKNHWYAVAIARDLPAGDLVKRRVLGMPVVLFRDEDGRPAAIEDRCPHRNVSLSLGCLVGSHVQCGYHGLVFDRTGRCVRMPNVEQPPAIMRVQAFPVVQKHGYVWLWAGDPALAAEDKIPDYSWQDDPAWVGELAWQETRCNYMLALENVLDLSHATYVHGETVGSPQVAQTVPEVVMGSDSVAIRRVFTDRELPAFYQRATGWEQADRTQTITYFAVNCVRLEITIAPVGNTDPGQVVRLMFGGPYTPSDDGSHLHFSSAYRNFRLDDAEMTQALIGTIRKAYAEDVPFLVDQQRIIDEGRSQPNRLFAVDRGPVAAMRLLGKWIHADKAARAPAAAAAQPEPSTVT